MRTFLMSTAARNAARLLAATPITLGIISWIKSPETREFLYAVIMDATNSLIQAAVSDLVYQAFGLIESAAAQVI